MTDWIALSPGPNDLHQAGHIIEGRRSHLASGFAPPGWQKPLATFLRRCRRVAAFRGAPSTHLGRGSVAAGLGDCLSYAWHTERIVMMAGSAHARSTHTNIEPYLIASPFNGTIMVIAALRLH